MNRLVLTTKTYVRPNGEIKINETHLRNVTKVLKNTTREEFKWVLIISNCTQDDLTNLYDRLGNYLYTNAIKVITSWKMSCSQARGYFYDYLSRNPSIDFDYTFDIDDDDYLINPDKLISIIKGPKMLSDLIGFGLEVDKEHYYKWDTWDFSEEYFKRARRYVTTDSQTMFLFFHSYRVCKIIQEYNWVTRLPIEDPHEKGEDTKMAIRLAQWNREHKRDFKYLVIGAIQLNLLHYNIHPDQMSNDTLDEDRGLWKSLLLRYGYNYVNVDDEFYKIDDSDNLVKFNPYE